MSTPKAIEVIGARTHNLKGVNCRIPHGKVTVVTGLSGAGKSSLAFDTVFAEGQRRFVESMSTYTRQFMQRMDRPPVDEIRNILPAVALEAKNSVRSARSTVGTLAEVADVLRLLFTHIGEIHCPDDDAVARTHTAEEIAEEAIKGDPEAPFLVVAPVIRPGRGANEALQEIVRQGYARRLNGGEIERMDSSSKWPKRLNPLPLVLGRFRAASGAGSRLVSTIEEALEITGGKVEIHGDSGVRRFSRSLACPQCTREFRRPVPALFSFNSPLGACPECQGFGRVIGVDRERVIPDTGKTLAEKPIAPWNSPAYEKRYDKLFAACEERGVPLDVPWRELSEEDRQWVWSGKGKFTNLDRFFRWVDKRSYKVHMRVLAARYRSYDTCPSCAGARLQPEALQVRVHGRTLPEMTALSIEEFNAWLRERRWSERDTEVAGPLLAELEERIDVLCRVGLEYLTLARQARTLSGGETQRIHLAAALGSGLTSTLYVLDEPTIGLHPCDSSRLLSLLKDLSRRGNTVLTVEHERTVIEGADHVIDIGPQAGEGGGKVLAEGSLTELLASEDSITADYLRERPHAEARRHLARFRREQGRESVVTELEQRRAFSIVGAKAHNLRDLTVGFPERALVAVTGVSGSGKSTLVENVLYANLQRRNGVVDVAAGECRELEGFGDLAGVALVDQQPLGRSARSNPVTYVKAYDDIRRLFAAEPLAQRRSIAAGHFSFNTDKGRCPECKGTGHTEVDMQFMSTVTVVCDQCRGARFRRAVLAVRHRGLNIDQTLDLTVDEARIHFKDRKRLVRLLGYLADAGLGYLRLGQPTSTLSGGEAQRLKLATFLADRLSGPHLLLFDEPTTGLHMADIELLCKTLRRLVKAGHSVVVVEHSPDLIARCDWIIDLGPGGGDRGGELLFSGPLQRFLSGVESPTASAVRRFVGWGREAG